MVVNPTGHSVSWTIPALSSCGVAHTKIQQKNTESGRHLLGMSA